MSGTRYAIKYVGRWFEAFDTDSVWEFYSYGTIGICEDIINNSVKQYGCRRSNFAIVALQRKVSYDIVSTYKYKEEWFKEEE